MGGNGNAPYLDTKEKRRKTRVGSENADTRHATDSMARLAQILQEQKIEIACIQETQNGRKDAVAILAYAISLGEMTQITNPLTEPKQNEKCGGSYIDQNRFTSQRKGGIQDQRGESWISDSKRETPSKTYPYSANTPHTLDTP